MFIKLDEYLWNLAEYAWRNDSTELGILVFLFNAVVIFKDETLIEFIQCFP